MPRSSFASHGPAHEVEVERRVQLVLAQVAGEPLVVGEPDLADEYPRPG